MLETQTVWGFHVNYGPLVTYALDMAGVFLVLTFVLQNIHVGDLPSAAAVDCICATLYLLPSDIGHRKLSNAECG